MNMQSKIMTTGSHFFLLGAGALSCVFKIKEKDIFFSNLIMKSGIGARVRYRRMFLSKHRKSGTQSAFVQGRAALMDTCIRAEQLSRGSF